MAFVFVPESSKSSACSKAPLQQGQAPAAQPKASMEWTMQHDVALCREVRLTNPFQAKKKTVARAQLWLGIAERLKVLDIPIFKETLTKRSVQDRCSLLCEKFKKKMAKELKDSVTSPDTVIEEIITLEEFSEEQRQEEGDEKKKKLEDDKQNAVEMRKKAMEKLSETQKRKAKDEEDEEGKEKKKPRRSGSDTIMFLKEKNNREFELKEKELELRKESQANERAHHDSILQWMIQQNQQASASQQHQRDQQLLLQNQLTQQNNMILAMMEKLIKK